MDHPILFVALVLILVTIFGIFFSKSAPSSPLGKLSKEDLEKYGFSLNESKGKHHFECLGFVLYYSEGSKRWVFDRYDIPKKGPGVLARFDTPLLLEDLQYCDAHIERTKTFNVRETYVRSGGHR